MQTIFILVSGEVQGVFYRQSTKEKAIELGITGWVKNLPDGKVEIIATGTKEQLDKLTAWCHRGPAKANVSSVEINEIALQHFEKFSIDRN